MAESLMHSVLSQCVLDVVFLSAAVPVRMKLVYLACCLSHFLHIEGLVYLAEPTLA